MLSIKEYFEEAELSQRTGHKDFTGRVFVYFNINLSEKLKTPYFSIQDLNTEKVIGHETSFMVKDAIFRVRPAGNAKVRETGRKNVHAGVVGYLVHEEPRTLDTPVTYDPYKYTSFVKVEDKSPVHSAGLVSFANRKLTAENVK
jgi:hypothetical protein